MRGALAVCGLLAVLAQAAAGQSGPPLPRVYNEARVDGRWSRGNAVELGWSLILPASAYVRTHLTAAGGYVRRDGVWARDSRYEVSARFLLDPFRQARYGLSFGGGLGTTNSDGLFSEPNAIGVRTQRWRPFILGYADLELRRTPGLTPALQIGIGSGVRAAFVVRSATRRWR